MHRVGTDYTFGPFRLSPDRRQLLEDHQIIRIGSRAFDLLSLLVSHAGEVISKEVLIKHAWPRTVVEETSLRFHIATIRKLLGDGQGGTRYIANISGRGYCFVAAVHASNAGDLEHPAKESNDLVRRPPHNLPIRLTRMLGRQALLQALADLLPTRRLITVLAAGGMGKSTLALALAERLLPHYPQGVWFIDLSVLKEEALVPSAVATALNIGVAPEDALPRLIGELQNHRTLLLLDNCEHVRHGVASFLNALLPATAGVDVLATSREALGASMETVQSLPTLATPAPGEAISAHEALKFSAVQLFVERAIAVLDSFELTDANAEAVGEICRRLDGMPLAIELAAARMDSFGAHGLVAQLKDRFPLLSGTRRDMPDRHRTLKALLDWSHAMLSPPEQSLLRQISIFSGAFSLDALGRVVSDEAQGPESLLELMATLAGRSLVSVDPSQQDIRYKLLDTTRLYALEKLRLSDAHADIRRRHTGFLCHSLGQSAMDWISLPREALMQKYAHLVDEVRGALDWAFNEGGDVAMGRALVAVAAGPLGHLVAHPEEFIARIQHALRLQAEVPISDTLIEYRLYSLLSTLSLMSRGPGALSEEAAEQACRLADAIGTGSFKAETHNARFVQAFASARYDEALRHAEAFSSVVEAQEHGEMPALAGTRLRALCLHFLGRHEEAHPLTQRVLQHPSPVVRVGPGYPYDRRVSMRILVARSLWMQGKPDQAMEAAREALQYAEQEQAIAMSHALAWAACPIALWNGQDGVAGLHVKHLQEHSALHRRGFWHGWGDSYALVLKHRCGQAFDIPGTPSLGMATLSNASLCDMLATFGHGFFSGDTLHRVRNGVVGWCAPEVLRVAGDRMQATSTGGDDTLAEGLYQEALDLAIQQSALGWELRAALSLATFKHRRGQRAEAVAILEPRYRRFSEGWRHADLRAARQLLEGDDSLSHAPLTKPHSD